MLLADHEFKSLWKDVRALTQAVGNLGNEIRTLEVAVYTLLVPVALLVLSVFVEKFVK